MREHWQVRDLQHLEIIDHEPAAPRTRTPGLQHTYTVPVGGDDTTASQISHVIDLGLFLDVP